MNPNQDTIAAISTPAGQAGIGIIRITGSHSANIARNIFIPRKSNWPLESHRLYLGDLQDPSSGTTIDEVLLSYMKAPNTYTKEDVVEINSHSGFVLMSRALQLVLDQGARLAMPGEFTLRAFLNGRIDLPQAEAVIDLINSRSEKGLQMAALQIKGVFGDEIESLKINVVDILSNIEVLIDFPDEDSDAIKEERLIDVLEKTVIRPIESLIDKHDMKRIWVDGIRTVIVGRVNAGKSSILNRLLRQERAIVTPIPGTTRDVIEATVTIEGIPLVLIDTAGLRKVNNEVERIGVRLTEEKLTEADLCLLVIDQSRPLNRDDLDILERCRGKKVLVVLNKIDLPPCAVRDEITEHVLAHPVVRVSALKGDGLDDLKKAIAGLILRGDKDLSPNATVTNLRHKEALVSACAAFKSAFNNIKENAPLEIIALELKSGLEALEEIVGSRVDDEVLDRIFSQFCLGK